jgi:hypothetical protein
MFTACRFKLQPTVEFARVYGCVVLVLAQQSSPSFVTAVTEVIEEPRRITRIF